MVPPTQTNQKDDMFYPMLFTMLILIMAIGAIMVNSSSTSDDILSGWYGILGTTMITAIFGFILLNIFKKFSVKIR